MGRGGLEEILAMCPGLGEHRQQQREMSDGETD